MTRRSPKVVQLVPASGGRPNAGYAASRLNATKHGVLSRHLVLPWEDQAEYQALVDALVAEYAPAGPTERHLVEEIAGIMWRRRRLDLAEAASYAIGVREATKDHRTTASDAVAPRQMTLRNPDVDFVAALNSTADEVARDLRAEQRASDKAFRAFKFLGGYAGLEEEAEHVYPEGAYQEALAMLAPVTQRWWYSEELDETAEALHVWLRGTVTELSRNVAEIENRGAIRNQALGTAFDPDRLDRLARYETHLDRKMERTVGMLIRLQELRVERPVPTA